MELKKYGGVFSFDKEKTEEYYKNRDDSLCSCENCKYYYSHIKGMFPKLEECLSDFGIDVERPDRVGSVDLNGETRIFEADYTVCGNLLSEKTDFKIDDEKGISVLFVKCSEPMYYFPNKQNGDYFSLIVTGFRISRKW